MSATNSSNNTQGYGGASFEPVSFDVETLEPDVYPGKYRAKCTAAIAKLSGKGKPMIEVEWKMVSTEDESDTAQTSIGANKRDWIVFASGRGGNFGKLKLRAIRTAMGLDPDVIPAQFGSLDELKPLCQAIKAGGEIDVWINDDPKGQEGDTRLEYTEPRTGGRLAPMHTADDEDEEEEAPPAPKKKTATPAMKKTARR